MIPAVLVAIALLTFFNGANDNFKGVATLYGARTASYRTALRWATVMTAAGGMLAPVIAAGLIGVFKAKGLVPASVASSTSFIASATLAAAATIAVATWAGLPVSTTHALTGGLVGAGLLAAGSALNLGVLGKTFALPLAVGPFVAVAVAALLGAVARRASAALDVKSNDCVCVGVEWIPVTQLRREATTAAAMPTLTVMTGKSEVCIRRYSGSVLGLSTQRVMDTMHFISAGAVSFARGVNDTPKLFALILAAGVLRDDTVLAVAGIAAIMAVGGLVGARRVAETTANKVVAIDPGTGLVANVTAAALVITGSIFKLPLSTTHVTMGGILGAGIGQTKVSWKMFGTIALAWVTTLPIAAAFGAGIFLLLSRVT